MTGRYAVDDLMEKYIWSAARQANVDEQEGRQQGVIAKPFVARHVAERLEPHQMLDGSSSGS